MFKVFKSRRGLTLVEIIISLAILGIIIVPLSTLFVNSAMINKRAEVQLLANRTAQQYMEEFKMKSFNELLAIMSGGTFTDNVGDMLVEVDIETLEALPIEIEYALEIRVNDTEIEFFVDGSSISPLDISGGENIRFNFSGTNYADRIEIWNGDIYHTNIADLYGHTDDKSLIKLVVDSDVTLNLAFSNFSTNSIGPLEVDKYVSTGITDNIDTAVLMGHVLIRNNEEAFTGEDRHQSAGLVITVRIIRNGQEIVEMAQAKKFEWQE
ncbi:MAG: type II secretion system GspH family protein [Clostridiales bacterium]|nr:type II secretion system GspH family protein [Clostridiales bacterium]